MSADELHRSNTLLRSNCHINTLAERWTTIYPTTAHLESEEAVTSTPTLRRSSRKHAVRSKCTYCEITLCRVISSNKNASPLPSAASVVKSKEDNGFKLIQVNLDANADGNGISPWSIVAIVTATLLAVWILTRLRRCYKNHIR